MNTHKRVIFFVGAGLSAESGIQTFRDSNGLWNNIDPMEVCNLDNFEKNYELVHKFYDQRRQDLKNVEPNKAHQAISELQHEYGPENVIVISTNVDDLLERAGCTEILKIHGDIKTMTDRWGPNFDVGYEPYWHIAKEDKPYRYKPGVVFFHEAAPLYADLDRIVQSLTSNDTFITIGSSEEVVPIGYMIAATGCACTSINVNPDRRIEIEFEHMYDFFIKKTAVQAFEDVELLDHIHNTMKNV